MLSLALRRGGLLAAVLVSTLHPLVPLLLKLLQCGLLLLGQNGVDLLVRAGVDLFELGLLLLARERSIPA